MKRPLQPIEFLVGVALAVGIILLLLLTARPVGSQEAKAKPSPTPEPCQEFTIEGDVFLREKIKELNARGICVGRDQVTWLGEGKFLIWAEKIEDCPDGQDCGR